MPVNLKSSTLVLALGCALATAGCGSSSDEEPSAPSLPTIIQIEGVAQNPEGVEYNKQDNTFFLSSLNGTPIVKVLSDGTFEPFSHGETFPLATAGLQIDHERSRLLAAGFNEAALSDEDVDTKGSAYLRVYNLETGALEQDVNLGELAPDASAYFANDIAVDDKGNAYVSDWYAKVVYKVDVDGGASIFWTNDTNVSGGPNGLDFHPDGYLLVSLLNVNDQFLYDDYGLVKIPLDNPALAKGVTISSPAYTGFDGMLMNEDGNVIGVTNDGVSPGGNVLLELSGENDWDVASVINSKVITASTTVATTADSRYYVINQDFSNASQQNWVIEEVIFNEE